MKKKVVCSLKMLLTIAPLVENVVLARLQMKFGFGLMVMKIIARIQKNDMEIKKLCVILFSFIILFAVEVCK